MEETTTPIRVSPNDQPTEKRILAIEPDLALLNHLVAESKDIAIVPFMEQKGDSVFDILGMMDILCNRPVEYSILFDPSTLIAEEDSMPEPTIMREILWKAIAILHIAQMVTRESKAQGTVENVIVLSSTSLYYQVPINADIPLSLYPPSDIFNTRQTCYMRAIQMMETVILAEWGSSFWLHNTDFPSIQIVRTASRSTPTTATAGELTEELKEGEETHTKYEDLAKWILDTITGNKVWNSDLFLPHSGISISPVISDNPKTARLMEEATAKGIIEFHKAQMEAEE